MIAAPRLRFSLVLLLCTALLAVRTVGDHLHLCFDGTEPPVALHGVDGEFEHELPTAAGGHHDVDVDLFHASLAKGALDTPELVGLLYVTLPVPPVVVTERWISRTDEPRPTSLSRYLRPPLRGPPSTTLS